MSYVLTPYGNNLKEGIGIYDQHKLQKTTLTLVRLALDSPDWLFRRSFITMPKIAKYTDKLLLTAP